MTSATSETHFIVQTFIRARRGNRLEPGQARQVSDASTAKRIAEVHAGALGAIAFSRTGDAITGDLDDAVILGAYGQYPEEVLNVM